jgi:hypothetical protein
LVQDKVRQEAMIKEMEQEQQQIQAAQAQALAGVFVSSCYAS